MTILVWQPGRTRDATRFLVPDFGLASQGDLRALTMAPGAWGEAFRAWRTHGRGKDVENRSHDHYASALLGRWVCIHTGATVGCKGVHPLDACENVNAVAAGAGLNLQLTPGKVLLRHIVAVGFVSQVTPPGDAGPASPWRFRDQWGYYFSEVVALEAPVPIERGMQGAWRVNGDEKRAVCEEFMRSRVKAGYR